MSADILNYQRIDSIRNNFLAAFESVYAELEGEVRRAREEVTALQNRVSTLERDKSSLVQQISTKSGELDHQRAQFDKLCDAHALLKVRARRFKQWIIERENLPEESRQKATEECPLGDISITSNENDPSPTNNDAPVAQSPPNLHLHGVTDEARSSTAARASRLSNPEDSETTPRGNGQSTHVHVGSDPASESTETASTVASQDAEKSQPHSDADQDSDTPKVVFERCLKRKRSARTEPYIKPEPLSPQRPAPDPASLDLDELDRPLDPTSAIGAHQDFELDDEKQNFASEEAGKDQLRQPANLKTEPTISSLGNRRCDRPTTGDLVYQDSNGTNTDATAPAPRRYFGEDHSSELPPSKPRRPLQPKTSNPRGQLRRHNRRDHRWAGVFGEDQAVDDENLLDCGPSPALQKLLHPEECGRDSVLTTPSRHLGTKASTAKVSGVTKRPPPSAAPTGVTKRRARPTEPSTTLRMLPTEELQPEDFIHNPARNDGVDFAFNEVVRKKDQRRCLPGCTKPECCGQKFMRAVEIGGFTTPARYSLGGALRGERHQVESDDQILRNFLGHAADRVDYMSSVERESLLQQAKAQAFAQFHGKHRNWHARPTTPPGFWRADMPSTQEAMEDGEASKALRQRTVEERRREAMQLEGRWVFRDEDPRTI